MTSSLLLIVKILTSVLKGPVLKSTTAVVNSDLPRPCGFFTGYVAAFVGFAATILVQSSSVFTSSLIPLVGLGVLSVERMYPMTLGSNIGTTMTSLFAALSQSGGLQLRLALQIAFCHIFFNVFGFLLFYPIPFMRIPIYVAKTLGDVTYNYRWFSLAYLIFMFGLIPVFVFGLSMAGFIYLLAIGGPIFLLLLIVVIMNIIQRKNPEILPSRYRDWSFLPVWLRSLQPYDDVISRMCMCTCCQKFLGHSSARENGSLKELRIDNDRKMESTISQPFQISDIDRSRPIYKGH